MQKNLKFAKLEHVWTDSAQRFNWTYKSCCDVNGSENFQPK
jgi:hypothetical protein